MSLGGVDQSSLVHAGMQVLLGAMERDEGFIWSQLSGSAKVCQLEHIADSTERKLHVHVLYMYCIYTYIIRTYILVYIITHHCMYVYYYYSHLTGEYDVCTYIITYVHVHVYV